MSVEEKSCPDCGEQMVRGFILDLTPSGQLIQRWVKGRPEKSLWSGVKTRGRECRSVETYRCVGCGLLRSYANAEVSPPGVWGV